MKNDKLLKLGIVAIALIFIFIAYKIFKVVSNNNDKIDISGNSFYQYFVGIKKEYSGKMNIVKYNEQKILVLEDNSQVYLDSTPMYYTNDLDKMLLPEKMEVVYPKLKSSYKLDDLSILYKENNVINIKKYKGSKVKNLESAFLFDGEDKYVFLDDAIINVGETQYEVSALSYASVNYRDSIEIYNYEKNEDIVLDDLQIGSDITASIDDYIIDMSVDYVGYDGVQQLLITKLDYIEQFEY